MQQEPESHPPHVPPAPNLEGLHFPPTQPHGTPSGRLAAFDFEDEAASSPRLYDEPEEIFADDDPTPRVIIVRPKLAPLMLLFVFFGLLAGAAAMYALKVKLNEPLMVERVIERPAQTTATRQANVPTLDPAKTYQKVASGVITVRATADRSPVELQGSGFIIDKEGWIVTNLHVLLLNDAEGEQKPAGSAKVRIANRIWIDLHDETSAEAKLVGYDPNADLALLKIDPARDGLGKLHALPLADSRSQQVGEAVMAIGAPYGNQDSLSVGIISATGRAISSLNGRFSIIGALQTDAAVNQGSSGGPLLNRHGEVVGINTQIQTEDRGNDGVAFAVPSHLLSLLLPRMKEGGEVRYAYAGLSGLGLTEQLAKRLNLPEGTQGVLLDEVTDDSPADKAGLRGPKAATEIYGRAIPVGSDIVLSIDDTPVKRSEDMVDVIMTKRPGQTVSVRVRRTDGSERTLTMTLAARPGLSA